ncbi:hypothetical protein CHH26_05120 [Qipengyuania flava]|nr:hypothetical protein CHH26_05120 [Qipengyuania flava]
MSKSIAERIEALRARAVKSLGPLGLLASGLLLFGVGIAADGIAAFALPVLGGFTILFSLDMKAEIERAAESERWAKLVASFLGDNVEKTFVITHKVDSIRPELDEIVRAEVAAALRAQEAHNG